MASISKTIACLRDKVRNTHWITTTRCSIIAPVMVIAGLDFGEVQLETVTLANFGNVFFSSLNIILAISQEGLVRLSD